jgi:hypothetical protein
MNPRRGSPSFIVLQRVGVVAVLGCRKTQLAYERSASEIRRALVYSETESGVVTSRAGRQKQCLELAP